MKAFYPELKQNVELKTRNYAQKYFITKADLLLFVLNMNVYNIKTTSCLEGCPKGRY